MPAAIAAAAQAAGAAAATAAANAGAIAAVQSIAALAAYTAVYVAAAVAATAVSQALAPDAPSPAQIQASKKQPRPVRVSGSGRARLGISYMLFEAAENFSYDVGAVHDGLTEGSTGRFWLHDDEAFIDGAGWVIGFSGKRYTPNHVQILTRKGEATETAYAPVVAALPTIWTNDHRGDAIASLALICNHSDLKYQPEDFPNGLPVPSAEWDMAVNYDPRDPAQDPDDQSTWAYIPNDQGRNPVLGLLWYLCLAEGGPRLNFARRFLPVIDLWKAAATVCDEAVPLKAGGTEPRYRMGGAWTWNSSPSSIIRNYLDTFDGWISVDGSGAVPIFAGKYYEPGPDDVITSAVGYTLRRFSNDEDAVNELVPTFVSPDHDYNQVETDPWRDETDIAQRGEVKSAELALIWVQSNGQCRRLTKRRMSTLNATASGTITTDLGGMTQRGKRYLRIALPDDVPTLRDLVVEISKSELDLSARTITFTFARADPLIDAWNPAAEEGDGVDQTTRLAPIYAAVPTILDVVPFFAVVGVGTIGVRLQVNSDQAVTADLLYAARWRRAGGVGYETGSPEEETAITGGSYIVTGFVPADAMIEVQLAAVNAAGAYTEWSPTFTVDTSTENVAPAQPTDLDAVGAVGHADVSWRNPTTSNLDHLILYRGTTAVFGSAAPLGSPIVGATGEVMTITDTVAAGTYYYWVQAFNANGNGSGPVGPDSATVT